MYIFGFQVAEAQAEESNKLRQQLNDESYVALPNSDAGKSKKTAADIAAMVADKLTASSSSQMIMTDVLSSFAAEAAKNAGLAKANSVSDSYPPQSVSQAPNLMSKLEQPSSVLLPVVATAAPAVQYHQSMLVNQQNLQNISPNPQAQYQLLSNAPTKQYAQTPRAVNSYGYGILPPTPPQLPPPPHVVGPMMPLGQPQLQMNQQLMPMAQQSAALSLQQPMPMMQQQPPRPPSFRPLQRPGMLFFTQPNQNQ